MARRKVEGECKLCGQQGPLCQSHIIFEYAYRRAYDATGTATALVSPHFREHPVQKGLWEHLLCRVCEDHFERIETSFRRYWGDTARFPAKLDAPFLRFSGFDYESTAKFLISVVWRAHVAKHRVLSAVDLGPHAEPMRSILRPGSIGSVGKTYTAVGYVLRDPLEGGLADCLVLSPRRGRLEGRWNYEFALLGILWLVFVSTPPETVPTSCRLGESGNVVMPVVNCTEAPSISRALKIEKPATRGLSPRRSLQRAQRRGPRR